MKTQYKEQDFKTRYAVECFRNYNHLIDSDLLQKLSDETAETALIYLILKNPNTITPKISALPPEISELDLGDGRKVKGKELLSWIQSYFYKETLNANFLFERIFQENKTLEDIIGICNNYSTCKDKTAFVQTLTLFPAEAVFIRTEIVHPSIKMDDEVYNTAMHYLMDHLEHPSTGHTAQETIHFPPLGIQAGPRMPILSKEKGKAEEDATLLIMTLINFWILSDEDLTQSLRKTFAVNFEQPAGTDLH